MARTRTSVAAVIGLLFVALATSPVAAQEEQQLSEAQAKRVQAAAKLNVLKASDDQLVNAVRTLDAGINAQSANSSAAEAALRAAQSRVGTAEARLARTEAAMAALRTQVATAAVRAYVNPGSSGLLSLIRARNLAEASRRQALLSHVVASDRDVLERIRGVREDQQTERARLNSARAQAAERTKAARAKLDELKRTRSSQVRLKAALDARIAAYTSEVEALAREEARINELIRSRVRGATGPGSAGRISGAGFSWPAAGTVTSRFGTRWGRLHAGIDIASRYGTPIKAAKEGRVVLAGYNGGYGNAVVIDHGGGVSTLYAHMSRVRVTEGASIKQGQQIGDMGSTGSSTGNHLHFEVRRGGAAQNPSRFLP